MQTSHWITLEISEKWQKIWNSYWITWQIDEKLKKCKTPTEYYGICSKGLKNALSRCMEIHPCFLQDIGPLRPLPCSHSTSPAVTPSRASGTADHVQSLDDLLLSIAQLSNDSRLLNYCCTYVLTHEFGFSIYTYSVRKKRTNQKESCDSVDNFHSWKKSGRIW